MNPLLRVLDLPHVGPEERVPLRRGPDALVELQEDQRVVGDLGKEKKNIATDESRAFSGSVKS